MLGHTVEIGTRLLEYRSWRRLPRFPFTPHAWRSGGFLDGTVAHMANHSSRAEVFSKGPGSNLTQDCLHRGQRLSGQERPNSCWLSRGRHINSWVVLLPRPSPNPPFPTLTSSVHVRHTGLQRPANRVKTMTLGNGRTNEETGRQGGYSWLTRFLFTSLFLAFKALS